MLITALQQQVFHCGYSIAHMPAKRSTRDIASRIINAVSKRQILIQATVVNGRSETPKTQSSYRAIQMSEPVYEALLREGANKSLI